MFKFLFDCSAFEISATTQAINDILFPVFLFAIILFAMCEIFLPTLVREVEIQIDENVTYQKDELKIKSPFYRSTIDNCKTKTELFDIEVEHQNLKALGVRKLKQFCKTNKVKGYSAAYSRGGTDGLIEFLIRQRIYVRNIEQQVRQIEI
ncbi:MAG: hypothetical protein AAFW70_01080 [Cyanobacteria bacterium J06635_10]